MPAVKTMSGTLVQSAADTPTSVLRQTGSLQSEFQGILPAYIRLELRPINVAMIPDVGAWQIRVVFEGRESRIALVYVITKTGAGGGVVFDVVREWYVPPVFPVMYDEEINITITSVGTGQLNGVEYVMFYDIVKKTELEMVQAISAYP